MYHFETHSGMEAVPTLPEFYDELAKADWAHQYSESFSVFKAGADKINSLRARANSLGPAYVGLFQDFNSWAHDQGLRPARPQ